MRANGDLILGYETRLDDGRGHNVEVDLPSDEEGADHGTSALELSVLALAGCVTTIFARIARRRRLTFSGLHISLVADRGARAATIERVHGELVVESLAPQGEVETVLRLTLSTCPVGVLFDRARIPVTIGCTVKAPEGLPRKLPEPLLPR